MLKTTLLFFATPLCIVKSSAAICPWLWIKTRATAAAADPAGLALGLFRLAPDAPSRPPAGGYSRRRYGGVYMYVPHCSGCGRWRSQINPLMMTGQGRTRAVRMLIIVASWGRA